MWTIQIAYTTEIKEEYYYVKLFAILTRTETMSHNKIVKQSLRKIIHSPTLWMRTMFVICLLSREFSRVSHG